MSRPHERRPKAGSTTRKDTDSDGKPGGDRRKRDSRRSLVSRRDDDETLVQLCLAGDQRAWRLLVLKYQRLIYSIARAWFHDRELADDVFQEVCVQLLRRLNTLQDVKALPAWLITVTRRQCSKLQAEDKNRSETDSDLESIAAKDRRITQIEDRFEIERAMKRLSKREQALIQALYLDPGQPSYAEIAERLGMPEASIGPTRARCLKKLARYLRDS